MIRVVESSAAAFAICALLTPLVRGVCIRYGLFDPPGPLKIHQSPIPRLGGIAITTAIVAGCVAGNNFGVDDLVPFLASLGIVWTVGTVDDVRGLPPLVRLAAQTVAALVLWRAGYGLHEFAHPVWNAIAICVLVIFFCNAANFLDGSDGLAAGVAAIIALAFFPIGTGVAHLNLVAGSVVGAATAFLIYNRPPASIFMGDGGSTTLGFALAFLTLTFARASPSTTAPLMFSLLVAAVPLFDALLAVIRRLRARKSVFSGDRAHFYDIGRGCGWSARKVGAVAYAITALLGGIAWIGLGIQPHVFAMITMLIFAVLFVIAVRIGSLRMDVELADDANCADTAPAASATPHAMAQLGIFVVEKEEIETG